MKPFLFLLFAFSAFAGSKADPSTWILWRAAPIAFPDSITPQVPELMQGEALIDFGKNGTDLTIVMPDGLGDDYDSNALDWTKRYVIDKVKQARVTTSSKVSDEDLQHHLLCLGTLPNNAFAAKIAGSGFLDGISPFCIFLAAEHPLPLRR